MNRATADALHRVNRDFYRRRAAEFSATRRSPWAGWRRVLEVYRGRGVGRGRILDLGCGNARLGAFLAPEVGRDHTYLGLDLSPALLAEAARFPAGFTGARFAVADLTAAPWPLAAPAVFTCVCAFGVLHHVAGRDNRRRFMARLGGAVAPGGMAAVSFWQFGRRARFVRRAVEWKGLDRSQREKGDFLLRWGDGLDMRYCHHVDEIEAAELAAASGLATLSTYRADGDDGRLNLYLLLTRGAAPPSVAAEDA